MREEELRRRVDQVALRCRNLMDTAPEEALKLVREMLHEAPANERLLAVQSSIVEQLSERSLERSRAQYLTRAHEALSSGRYSEALRLLESCQKEGISSPEIAELMDFARQEADRRQKNSRFQELLKQAQDLMSRGSYAAWSNCLRRSKKNPKPPLCCFYWRMPVTICNLFERQIDESLHFATVLATREQHAEAVKFLESQEPSVLQSEPVQTALQRLRAAREEELATLQAVGRAYAALDRSRDRCRHFAERRIRTLRPNSHPLCFHAETRWPIASCPRR